MYCSYCAAVLESGVAACPRCGRAIASGPEAIPFSAKASRPQAVRVAIFLLLIAAALGLLSLLMFLSRDPRIVSRLPTFYFVQSFGFLAVWIGIIALLWKRHGWARIAMVLMVLWFFGNLAFSLFRVAGSGTFGIGVSFAIPVAVSVLRVAALILLFMPESNAWFARR